MAGRLQVGTLARGAAALLLIGVASVSGQPAPLVSYSFDDERIEAGPDTFAVFQKGQGAVTLSTLNRFSGYRAVELRDVPGDGTFPELQGYFPRRTSGKLYLHFALMTTDPAEELNIALAGPQWSALRKHGIGFWLKTSGGYLTAISDSRPKRLFPMRGFVWYVADIVYGVDTGTYDLTIRQEGVGEPVVEQHGQPNAPNQAGSHVDKFSFIGDHTADESKVVYFVDDIVVSVDEPVAPAAFAAPGRRKLFVDYWNEARRAQARRPAPLPVMKLEDLGIGTAEMDLLRRERADEMLQRMLAGRAAAAPEQLTEPSRGLLQAVAEWRAGNAALSSGEARAALAHFDRASALVPTASLYKMNSVMALTHLERWDEVDRRLAEAAADWRADSRLPVALVRIGLARGDLDGVERQLRQGAEANGMMAEQYFLVLLWRGETGRAERFAEAMGAADGRGRQFWQERLGDAAFLAGDVARARVRYEAALDGNAWRGPIWSKLSDVYFKLGDLAKEREFRELVYGTLRAR